MRNDRSQNVTSFTSVLQRHSRMSEEKKNLRTSVLFRQIGQVSNKPVNVYQLTKKTPPQLSKKLFSKALQGQQPRDLLQEGELGTSADTCDKEAQLGHPEHSHCWATAHPKYLSIRCTVSTPGAASSQ